MCLSVVHCAQGKRADYFVGWKVFEKVGNKLYFMVYYSGPVQTREWLKASGQDIKKYDKFSYRAGFHIFLNESEARNYRNNKNCKENYEVRKVKFRDIVAIGEQYNSAVVVAKEMMVLKSR